MSKNTKKPSANAFTETEIINRTNSIFDSEIFWRGGAALVLIVAAVLRFYDLSLKPFHHDEGVNGFFLTNLVRQGIYHYDPQNYHGPTLYFFAQASTALFGLNDFGVRFVPAICGVFCVVGILFLRRYLGSVGALAAAALTALSPGMVFISRYFIHEMPFVFFTFAVPLCIVKFIERKRASRLAIAVMFVLLLVCILPGTLNFASAVGGENVEIRNIARIIFLVVEALIVTALIRLLTNWNDGRFIYLLLAAAAAVLTFATKETAFISFGTMMIAVFSVWLWRKLRGGNTPAENDWHEPVELTFKSFSGAVGDSNTAIYISAFCLILFVYVGALFFSSFFTYPEGIWGAFKAYFFWTKTGGSDHTQNGVSAYFKWMLKIEAPLLILGVIGALVAVAKAKHRFALFAALWGFGLLAAYTIIPYKTPWLAVNFLLPLAIIGGYGINELAISADKAQRGAAAFLAAVALGVCAYQTVDFNFYKYDDDTKPYVYAHTKREFFDLVKEIGRVADISGKGKEASVIVVSPDYWGLPWYLRDYPHAAFYGQITPEETSEMVLGSVAQAAELNEEYARHYDFVGTYTLRPGVDLMLYVRRDLTDKVTAK